MRRSGATSTTSITVGATTSIVTLKAGPTTDAFPAASTDWTANAEIPPGRPDTATLVPV